MATNYAVRVTRSYEQCAAWVARLSLRCDKLLAYEHVGTETEKVHIHLMLVGVRCDVDTLKNDAKATGLGALKGNGDWTFKTKDKKYGDVTDSPTYITYMTKGIHDPKYNKGYTAEEVAACKAAFVNHDGKSRDEKEYAAFEERLRGENIEKDKWELVNNKMLETYPGFTKVRKLAINYALAKCKVMNIKCKNLAQMLYNTYCWRHEVPKPERYDRW